MKIEHIIVATDLQENSGIAAQWAAQLATKVEAEVTVLHVVESGVMSWLKSELDVFDDPKLVAELEDKVRQWYVNASSSNPQQVVVRPGSVLARLEALVGELGENTLVVFARSNKGSIEQFFLGSTVQQVVSNPPAAVAVVHPDHTSIDAPRAIVTGTDFSENARRAVVCAASLGKKVDAKLTVVHAVAAPETSALYDLMLSVDSGLDIQTHVNKLATDKLNEFVQNEFDGDVESKVIFETAAVDALIDEAHQQDADLIVVGHGGESPVVQNVIGTVTQSVLRNAGTTVIVVPLL